jgi:hypothetical protein
MDSQIPEWQHPVLQESAIEALSIYETMSKKKKVFKLECAIGRLNRDVMGRWIVVNWHIKVPDFMEIRLY